MKPQISDALVFSVDCELELADFCCILQPVGTTDPLGFGLKKRLVMDLLSRVRPGHIDCLSCINEWQNEQSMIVAFRPTLTDAYIHDFEVKVVGPVDPIPMASNVWDCPCCTRIRLVLPKDLLLVA